LRAVFVKEEVKQFTATHTYEGQSEAAPTPR
jgi:hypothetical protein